MPKWLFSWKSFRELFDFGWKLMVSSLIDVVWREVYQLVIGKCYTTATLGQFTRGKQFSDLFSVNLTAIIQRVSFPVLSSIQDEGSRLKEGYRRIIKTSMLISFVCLFGLAAIAKPLIIVLIGDQWLEAARYLQIICLSACLYPLHAINLNMLQVQGRSDLFLRLEIIKKTVAVGPIMLGIFVGIEWMLWSSVISSIFAYFLNAYYSGRMIGYSSLDQIRDILPSMGIATLMGIVVYIVSFISIAPLSLLFLQLIVGSGVFVGLGEWTHLSEYIEIRDIFLGFCKKIFRR